MSKNDTKATVSDEEGTQIPENKWEEERFAQSEAVEDGFAVEDDSVELQSVASGGAGSAEVERLQAQLAAKEQQFLRLQADVKNAERHMHSKVLEANARAVEKFVTALLPVIDSLEQGIESCEGEAMAGAREGMALTLKAMLDALQKFSVQVLDPTNEKFDPSLHEAISMQESADAPANTVLMVVQKGYAIEQRVIRPARVIVAKSAN